MSLFVQCIEHRRSKFTGALYRLALFSIEASKGDGCKALIGYQRIRTGCEYDCDAFVRNAPGGVQQRFEARLVEPLGIIDDDS